VIIGGNGDSIYKRLMHAAGRADLAEDPRLAHNAGRVEHQQEIDTAIAAWTATLDSPGACWRGWKRRRYRRGQFIMWRTWSPTRIFWRGACSRQWRSTVKLLKIPAIFPKLAETPGATDWPGPEIGSHNMEVFSGLLGLSAAELATLKGQGVF
jgi:crotonobetainyl-CoA:carnitine CoA-transferase CaiB-like acyl-CoA transferase